MEPKRIFTIGRSTGCDIILADLSVSRHHAELHLPDDGKWLLKDLDSQFGTFIVQGNKAKVVRDEAHVSSSDILRFGNLTITVRQLQKEAQRKFPVPIFPRRFSLIRRGIAALIAALVVVLMVLYWEKVQELLANSIWTGIGAIAAILTVILMLIWKK
uniref:FHA domain-containing protein n=1 Tax=Candidatus Kentrum sp. DK TaxID=2126562 RepID=A0A450SVB0_9GAMM|nr:MAG: FHA domain-containing protein [Candidatus Kentron sp. DK]